MNPTLSPPLSPRLLEVAELVARGYSNKMIATDLHISEGTAATYIKRIIRRVPGRSGTRYRIIAWWFGPTR